MSKLRIKQVRSSNRTNTRQRDTLRSLKLNRIGREVTMDDSPQLQGMLRVVGHLVEVETGDGAGRTEEGAA
jgi:large subunit ribosomal protein L30